MSATKDARIKELEAEVVKANEERDEARAQATQATTELHAVTGERDKARNKLTSNQADYEAALSERDEARAAYTECAGLLRMTRLGEGDPDASTEPTTEAPAATDPHAGTRALLKRMGLKRAYVLNGELCFDENHAKFTAGEKFSELEVIPADE